MLRRHILNGGIVGTASRLNRLCSDASKKSDDQNTKVRTECEADNIFELPPEPDNCCMSGCANCVWIQYAKDLTDLYQDSGGAAKKVILEKIKDPTMQVFIKMELSSLSSKK